MTPEIIPSGLQPPMSNSAAWMAPPTSTETIDRPRPMILLSPGSLFLRCSFMAGCCGRQSLPSNAPSHTRGDEPTSNQTQAGATRTGEGSQAQTCLHLPRPPLPHLLRPRTLPPITCCKDVSSTWVPKLPLLPQSLPPPNLPHPNLLHLTLSCPLRPQGTTRTWTDSVGTMGTRD